MYFMREQPRAHQQQCRSNIVECYKLNDSFDKVECCFDIVAETGNNVEATCVNETRFYRQFRGPDKAISALCVSDCGR